MLHFDDGTRLPISAEVRRAGGAHQHHHKCGS
jgi:hypothetical protein